MPDPTMILTAVMVLLTWLVSAVLLRVGCAFCRAPKPGMMGAMLLILFVGAATVSMHVLMVATLGMSWTGLELTPQDTHALRLLLAAPVHMLAAATIYKMMLPTTFGRATVVWLVQTMLLVCLCAVVAMMLSRLSPAAWASIRAIPMKLL